MFSDSVALWGTMAVASCSGIADSCRAQEGVRDVVENGEVKIVSTVRVPVDAKDEESVRFATSQDEIKAKDQLLRYGAKEGTPSRIGSLSGVILQSSCGSGAYLYVTVETSNSLRRDSK